MKNRSSLAWPALVVVAAVAGFSASALASSDDDGARTNRRITVSGTATVSTRPDEAVVDLGVRSEAPEGATAMEANATKMSAVLEALADAGVDRQDIETTRVSLERRRVDRRTDRERIVFVAQNSIEVTITDLDTAGTVIDAAVQAGADAVRNIRFQVSNPTEIRRQALEQAVHTARAKADAMAAAAGSGVTDVVSITEQGDGLPEVGYNRRLAIPSAAVTPILPTRDIETRISVSVVWLLAG